MSLVYRLEQMYEEVAELYRQIDDLEGKIFTHRDDVLFLHNNLEEIFQKHKDSLPLPVMQGIQELLYNYEYEAVEEKRKEEIQNG